MGEEYFIGLDLGQVKDYPALAVVERAEAAGEWDPVVFAYRKQARLRLRHVERMRLGTAYPDMVRRVAAVTSEVARRGRCHLVVDATGVGRPVIDLLRRAGLACRLWPVSVTSGNAQRAEGGVYHVPKRDLIVGLQVVLQGGELQIARSPAWGRALTRELVSVRVKVTSHGHELYGAWREGEHDDMVFAVALGCWGVKKVYGGRATGVSGWCTWRE